uniref:Uncharacterized protein n=1 Tax=Ananas comosus var. bracteatus TaxID=296719 RepID=A0A6V7Q9E7_ANACO|nr:unnamed protein product [Ananas comosus var. bracteatus]
MHEKLENHKNIAEINLKKQKSQQNFRSNPNRPYSWNRNVVGEDLEEKAWAWRISLPLSLFPPCWCLKAWTWSLQERRYSPLELGLELLRRAFEARFLGLEPSFGLDWKDPSLLSELERDFLLPRVF